MRKIIILTLVLVFTAAFALSALAEQHKEGEYGMKNKSSMMKGAKGMSDKGATAMMMKSMMNKSVVATSDGGVIVMVGNKLMKYDKDLNLKKEVKIEMDMQEMKDMMSKCKSMMAENCRMKQNEKQTPKTEESE